MSFIDFENNGNITYLRLSDIESLNNINLKNGANVQLAFLLIQDNENLQCV